MLRQAQSILKKFRVPVSNDVVGGGDKTVPHHLVGAYR